MLDLAWASLLASDEEIALGFFAVAGGVALAMIVACSWRRNRQAAYNARLKQLMIERGMSADEIVRVVQAGRSVTDAMMDERWGRFSCRKPEKQIF